MSDSKNNQDLIPIYLLEHERNTHVISNCLLQYEKNSEKEELSDRLFRCLSNIKSLSFVIGLDKTGELFHVLEALLLGVKNKQIFFDSSIVSITMDALDSIKEVVNEVEVNESVQDTDFYTQTDMIKMLLKEADKPATPEIKKPENEESLDKDDIFDTESFEDVELKDNFVEDCKLLLEDLETLFLKLENNPSDPVLIDDIFRGLHTIKGNSLLLPVPPIAKIAHSIENFFSDIRNGFSTLDSSSMDLLLEGLDYLVRLTHLIDQNKRLDIPIKSVLSRLAQLREDNRQVSAKTVNKVVG